MTVPSIRLLQRSAASSNHPKSQHSALVVKHGKIISIGHNSTKTAPMIGYHSYIQGTHAEFVALKKAGENARGSMLISFRAGGNMISKPCQGCTQLLRKYGVRRVLLL